MGFTRYWTFDKLDEEKFGEFSKICQTLIDELNVPLDDITINDKLIRFNGVDDDSHETFHFSLDKSGFNFCKTNLKPYDLVVCGCLYVAKIIFDDSIKINGDCDESEDLENIQSVKSIIRNNNLNKIL